MYGLWLFKELRTKYGHCKVEVFRKGYTASAVEIGGFVGNSLNLALENLDTITAPIGKSVCSFSIYDTDQVEYDDLFTPDATAYKVVISTKVDGGEYNTRWSGYVTPDFFAENLSFRTPISISARDNIGYLNDVDFDLDTATITVRELIQAAFNRIAEDYPMSLSFVTQKQTAEGILAIDATISTYLLREMSWYEALETILHDLGLQMRWVDNNTIAVLDISQLGENFGIQRFNFIERSGYREILPAWRELAQEQSYGVLDNFYKGQIDRENKLEYAANSAINTNILLYQPKAITQWSRQGEIYFLNFYNSYNAEIDDNKQDSIFITGIAPTVTNAEVLEKKMVYSQAVTEVDKQIKMTFSLNDTLRTPLASQYSRGERNTLYLPYSQSSGTTMLKTPRPYQLKFRFNIFLRANDGTNYLMREDWVEESALSEQPFIEFLTDKLQTVDTGVTDGQGNHRFAYTGYNNSKEYSITIGSIPKAGTLEFVVYPWTFEKDDYSSARDTATYQRGAKISNIVFSVQVGKTGVETKTQVGVLHNIAEKANYSFGQVPQREGDIITYAGGLFKSDTVTALQGFKRNIDSTTYPLLELVGREIIHFNKKNYNKLSGTIKNLAKEPLRFDKVFIYKGRNYLPFACSLDVISNTMNITTMQEVEPYTTHSFVEIKSELVTGGGATISGGNNTALQYSAEVGNAKRISELNNASESEKREAYVVIDNVNWPESKKVPFFDIVGLNEAQVGDYLTENKYAKQSWVKNITDNLATNLNKATTRISTLEGYFSNGVANNAAKLGGQLPSYYATKSALDTTNTNLSNLSTTVGTIAGNLSSLTGRVSTAEDTIKGHTSSINKAVADIAANAKNISTNATNITTVANRVKTLEDLGFTLKDGYIYTEKTIVSKGEIISGRRASGASTDVGGGGISQVTAQMIADALGYIPYSSANPAGYINSSALEQYVTSRGYITADALTKANVGLGEVQNYGVFNQTSFKGKTQYAIVNSSVLEIANRIDFHINEGSADYEVSLRVASGEVTKRVIYLPSAEGTLALVSQLPTIPTALKSPYALTFGNKTYDGSEAKTITAADLGALSTGGGTISKSSYVPLVIQNTASDLSTILYKGTSGDLGYLGFNGASNPIYMAPSGYSYTLYHTGNFNPANYLPLSGGTLTGDLTIKTSGQPRLYLGTAGSVHYSETDKETVLFCGEAGYPALKVRANTDAPIYRYNYADYTLIHSGNIGSYALKIDGSNAMTAPLLLAYNSSLTEDKGIYVGTTNVAGGAAFDYASFVNIHDKRGSSLQLSWYRNVSSPQLVVRISENSNWSSWKTIAFTDSNVASATYASSAGSADVVTKTYGNQSINFANNESKLRLIKWGGSANAIDNGFPEQYTSGLSVMTDYTGWQMVTYGSIGKPNPYFRSFGDDGRRSEWNQLAFLTDNVASATKLQTARTIWGQSFDGTGNVSGDIIMDNYTAIKYKNAAGTTSLNAMMVDSSNNLTIGYDFAANSFPTRVDGTSVSLRYGTGHTTGLMLASSGNVLIGTTTDSGYKLDVRGGNIATDYGIVGVSSSTYNRWSITHGSNRLYIQSGLTDGSGTSGDVWISGVNTSSLGLLNIIATTMTLSGNLTVNGAISTTGSATIGGVIVTNSGRLRVNTSNSVNSFGYLKATAYTSSLNRAVLDIGSNYGGTSNITSESVDVTALSIYRGVVGVGRAYSYDELYANYNSNTKLYVDGGIANTRTHAASHWDALKIISVGSWSAAPNYVNGIGVTDGSGVVGRFGISFNGTEGGYFSIRDLYTNAGGYASSGEIFKVVGNGNVYVYGNLITSSEVISSRRASSSDRRLKDAIRYLSAEQSLNLVRLLRPAEWDWKDDGKHSMGFIAQEVEHLMPYAVTSIKDDILGQKLNLQYDQFIALAIGGVQAVDNEVKRLKARVEYLENKIKEYEYGNYRN